PITCIGRARGKRDSRDTGGWHLRTRRPALGTWHSALGTQHPKSFLTLRRRPGVWGVVPQLRVSEGRVVKETVGTQGAGTSERGDQHSASGTRHLALSTRHLALSTRHSAPKVVLHSPSEAGGWGVPQLLTERVGGKEDSRDTGSWVSPKPTTYHSPLYLDTPSCLYLDWPSHVLGATSGLRGYGSYRPQEPACGQSKIARGGRRRHTRDRPHHRRSQPLPGRPPRDRLFHSQPAGRHLDHAT